MSFFVQSGRWLHSNPGCVFVLPTLYSLGQVTERVWLKCQYFPRSEVMGKHEGMQGREEDGWELSGSHGLLLGWGVHVSTNVMCGFLCNS